VDFEEPLETCERHSPSSVFFWRHKGRVPVVLRISLPLNAPVSEMKADSLTNDALKLCVVLWSEHPEVPIDNEPVEEHLGVALALQPDRR
jgi:hypothetical protein